MTIVVVAEFVCNSIVTRTAVIIIRVYISEFIHELIPMIKQSIIANNKMKLIKHKRLDLNKD